MIQTDGCEQQSETPMIEDSYLGNAISDLILTMKQRMKKKQKKHQNVRHARQDNAFFEPERKS